MSGNLYCIELTVTDWPRAVAWYRDVFRLELLLLAESDQFALFRAGSTRLALKAGVAQPGSVLLAFEVDDLAAEIERLARLGVSFDGPPKTSPEGYRRVLFRDSDGYRLSLFEWTRIADPSGPG